MAKHFGPLVGTENGPTVTQKWHGQLEMHPGNKMSPNSKSIQVKAAVDMVNVLTLVIVL